VKKFVNEYEYNTNIAKENINKWWNLKFKKSNITLIILLILVLILFLINKKTVFLISIFIILVPIVFFVVKKNIALNLEVKKIKELYNKDNFKFRVEIDKNIKLITPRGEKEFELNIIDSFYETENLIVLNNKNSTTIALKKDSFIKGTDKEFLLFLKDLKKEGK